MLNNDADDKKEETGCALSLKKLFVLFCFVIIDSSSCSRWPGNKCFSKSMFNAQIHSGPKLMMARIFAVSWIFCSSEKKKFILCQRIYN